MYSITNQHHMKDRILSEKPRGLTHSCGVQPNVQQGVVLACKQHCVYTYLPHYTLNWLHNLDYLSSSCAHISCIGPATGGAPHEALSHETHGEV